MVPTNINSMSDIDMRNLIGSAKQEMLDRSARGSFNPTKEVQALAASRGFNLHELQDAAIAIQNKAPKVPAKYRDPANPQTTWSGRGKQPLWFKKGIEEGKTPEDFLISKK